MKKHFVPTILCAALLAACGSNGDSIAINEKPAFVATETRATYDGTAAGGDLLTGGLGRSGLASATPPAVADPLNPTAFELRRLAIYVNYRALVDTAAAGGYGTFYGPNVDANNVATASEGLVAGTEYLALSDDGSGREKVTLMVQIPASFDRNAPCITTAVSSGSRGIYGAISVGEWGLKRGCAVAYTDKGTGAAPHDLQNDTVPLVDGRRAPSATAGADAQFRAELSAPELAAFNAATPNRFAFKHAHSQRNPEKDWGLFTRRAIEYAFYAINQEFGTALPGGQRQRDFHADNTLVIASAISNGGGAAIAAAEGDTAGLIDAVVVGEPQVQLPSNADVAVQRGATALPATAIARTLYDYDTLANLYGPCAALSAQLAGTPFQATYATIFGTQAANRCASLRAKDLLSAAATTTALQADESLQRLRDAGWESASLQQLATFAGFEIQSAIAVTYANTYSRSSVRENLCGYSFASTTAAGAVQPLAPAALATMFSTGSGVPPSAGVNTVNNANPTGPLRDVLSVSPSTGIADMNIDGAICLRNLLAGSDAKSVALRAGIDEVRRSGNLRGKPALIVHGREDALVPVNHSSRPYAALNRGVEGAASRLSYIEVANAQHFDGFIDLGVTAGFDTRYVPLHLYLFRALDAMWAHLRGGAALPPSQVVRGMPRGGTAGSAPPLAAANVPAIAAAPAAADQIVFDNVGATSRIRVPD